MRAGDGFVADAAFQDATGAGVVDRSDLFFVGGSQGGILGGATTAVATDWDAAFLAVPGVNYSLLLPEQPVRHVAPLIESAYPNAAERTVVVGVMQMLWDRGRTAPTPST